MARFKKYHVIAMWQIRAIGGYSAMQKAKQLAVAGAYQYLHAEEEHDYPGCEWQPGSQIDPDTALHGLGTAYILSVKKAIKLSRKERRKAR